ncbi:MAG: redoxin domain-containing protein [Chloroflexi bacterium]|nr:redoxin domain-containing protein [Chloroflexota bacterium]
MSYDGVEALRGFGAKYGISYPLLSDEGSAVIRALGLLNEQAAEPIMGIPHPGTFVLNADGSVRSKHFYPSYRERDTGVGVLEHLLGVEAAVHGAIRDASVESVAVSAWFDKDSYAWGQRIWLTVELDIPAGLHVYGRPIPDGYHPLEVELEPIERVLPGPPRFPETKPFRIDGLDEAFHVYEGKVRVQVPVTFMLVDGGTLDAGVRVSFQACTTTECLAPQSLRLVLPIAEQPLVERPQPRA